MTHERRRFQRELEINQALRHDKPPPAATAEMSAECLWRPASLNRLTHLEKESGLALTPKPSGCASPTVTN